MHAIQKTNVQMTVNYTIQVSKSKMAIRQIGGGGGQSLCVWSKVPGCWLVLGNSSGRSRGVARAPGFWNHMQAGVLEVK